MAPEVIHKQLSRAVLTPGPALQIHKIRGFGHVSGQQKSRLIKGPSDNSDAPVTKICQQRLSKLGKPRIAVSASTERIPLSRNYRARAGEIAEISIPLAWLVIFGPEIRMDTIDQLTGLILQEWNAIEVASESQAVDNEHVL
jgi:hypothetical protein